MRIESIEGIEWKTISPLPGEFPCFACHGMNGNATHFIKADIETDNGKPVKLRLPVCAKCADYANRYPGWLEEILIQHRIKTIPDLNTEAIAEV